MLLLLLQPGLSKCRICAIIKRRFWPDEKAKKTPFSFFSPLIYFCAFNDLKKKEKKKKMRFPLGWMKRVNAI